MPNCSCQNSKINTKYNNQLVDSVHTCSCKLKKLSKHRSNKKCKCSKDIYIPFPVTNTYCDGPRVLGISQGNVEIASKACDNINDYY
jgi:hypothetical protein